MRKVKAPATLDETAARDYLQFMASATPHDLAVHVYHSYAGSSHTRRALYDPWRRGPLAFLHRAAVDRPPLFGLSVAAVAMVIATLAGMPLALSATVIPPLGLIAFGLGTVAYRSVSVTNFYTFAAYSLALRRELSHASAGLLARRRKLKEFRQTAYLHLNSQHQLGHPLIQDLQPEARAFLQEAPQGEELTMERKTSKGVASGEYVALTRGKRAMGVVRPLGMARSRSRSKKYQIVPACCGMASQLKLDLKGPQCRCGAMLPFAIIVADGPEALAAMLSSHLCLDPLEAAIAINEIDRQLFG